MALSKLWKWPCLLLLLFGLFGGIQTQTPACGLDIVFVMDGSSSMNYMDWQTLKTVVARVVQALELTPTRVNVGIVAFATSVTYVSPNLSYNKAFLLDLVENQIEKPDTGTFTDLAIGNATLLLKTSRPEAADVIIVVTDGATETEEATAASVRDANNAGITIYAIGVGSAISRADLEILTDPSRIVNVGNFNDLLGTLQNITDRACSEVTTTRTTPTTTTTRTTTTPAPSTTTTPAAPVIRTPVCRGIMPTNIWLLNDMSSGAEALATRSSRFDLVQEAVTAFLDDPSLSAASDVVQLGLINYNSAGSRVTRELTPYTQAANTFSGVVPDAGLLAGTYDTATGLRTVSSFPADANADDWVVVITSVDTRSEVNIERAANQSASLQSQGYKIYTISISGPDGTLAEEELSAVSSGGKIAKIANYRQLTDALAEFVQTQVCPLRDDLCAIAKKKDENDTTGFVYHPTDCDKFIQCHFYPTNTVAVYRTCPLGQYWDHASVRCSEACNVDCPYEKCHTDGLESYKMEGSCRAYWRCFGFKSVPACCAKGYSYVDGYGCVTDPSCDDFCGHNNMLDNKGVCREDKEKQPTVMFSRDSNQLPAISNRLWHLKTWFHQRWTALSTADVELCEENDPTPLCDGHTFDLVTCRCAPKNLTNAAEKCRPSVNLNFAQEGKLDEVPEDVYDLRSVTLGTDFATFPGTFGSLLHLAVEDREDRPLAFTLIYRENQAVEEEVALVRSTRCGNEGALYVALTPDSVKAEISSPDGKLATTAVSLLGFSASDWKNLTLVYDGTSLTLSVRNNELHYVSRVDAPKVRCFTCGVDVAPGSSSTESFSGDLQLAEVSYCYPASVEADPGEPHEISPP